MVEMSSSPFLFFCIAVDRFFYLNVAISHSRSVWSSNYLKFGQGETLQASFWDLWRLPINLWVFPCFLTQEVPASPWTLQGPGLEPAVSPGSPDSLCGKCWHHICSSGGGCHGFWTLKWTQLRDIQLLKNNEQYFQFIFLIMARFTQILVFMVTSSFKLGVWALVPPMVSFCLILQYTKTGSKITPGLLIKLMSRVYNFLQVFVLKHIPPKTYSHNSAFTSFL